MLTSASGGIALSYDPAMRLYQTSGGTPGTARLAYDGTALIAEYNGSNTMLRRYVHGPSSDEPLVWYEGSGTSDRRFLHVDERGSIVAVTNSSGTTLNVNGYDEYGIPSSGNVGRFQYTGQTWLPELGMYYYKARIYSPTLGRFLQPDPIGYGDGMNMYAYVGGDPVNAADPSGMDMENALSSNRAYPIDNDDEWYLGKGVNLIALAGGHSRDGMGMWDNVFSVSGRVDVLSYERAVADLPEATRKLNRYSASMGVSAGCLLNAGCTASAVSSLSKNASSLGNLSKDLLVSGRAHSLKLMAAKGNGKHEWTMQPLASRDFIWYELRTAFGGEVTKPRPDIWILNITPNSKVIYRSSTLGGGRTLEFRNPYLNNRGYLKFRFSY
jgi:RHS repeat-associated protein